MVIERLPKQLRSMKQKEVGMQNNERNYYKILKDGTVNMPKPYRDSDDDEMQREMK